MQKEYDLVRRAAEGDERAFEALVQMYEKTVYAYAYRMLSSREDAEEVTQDVFLKVWRTLSGFRWESSLSTWILRITRNAATDAIRRRNPTSESLYTADAEGEEYAIPVADATPESNPELAYEQKERRELVQRAIATLDTDFREILILREIEGLSYAEIASILEIEEGTVKSRISRARQNLKKILKEWNFPL